MNVNFDSAQIITIASVGLVVIGWFVNQWLNRRNEILKKRMEYRTNMLRKVLRFAFSLMQMKLNEKLLMEINEELQLYGTKEEYHLFENFKQKWHEWRKAPADKDEEKYMEVNKSLQKLVDISLNRFRRELRLGKLYKR
jgi:hypothetical protein